MYIAHIVPIVRQSHRQSEQEQPTANMKDEQSTSNRNQRVKRASVMSIAFD